VPESSTERLRFLKCRKCTRERFCCPACQLFHEYAEKIISIEHRVLRGEVSWDCLTEDQYRIVGRILKIWQHSGEMTHHAPSQMALGMVYEYGYGVNQSDFEAVKWYQMASDKGLTEAQARLGKMLRDGRGTKRPNDKKALTLFRDAARGGNAEAFFNIGKVGGVVLYKWIHVYSLAMSQYCSSYLCSLYVCFVV
jgi:TPR repeat protein